MMERKILDKMKYLMKLFNQLKKHNNTIKKMKNFTNFLLIDIFQKEKKK